MFFSSANKSSGFFASQPAAQSNTSFSFSGQGKGGYGQIGAKRASKTFFKQSSPAYTPSSPGAAAAV